MDTLIRSARVFTGRAVDPVDRLTVAIADDRIVYVGADDAAPAVGDGVQVIDGAGRTLLPGLIDSHCHITLDEEDTSIPRTHNRGGDVATSIAALRRSGRALRAGITTLRDCMTASSGIWAVRAAIRAGDFPGPTLVLSGRAVVATGGHMHYIANTANGADDVRRAVREEISAGADFIKLAIDNFHQTPTGRRAQMQMTLDEVRAAVETAHSLLRPITAHAVSEDGIERALQAGVDCIEHGETITPALAERMVAQGTWLVPTLSVPVAAGDAQWLPDATRANLVDMRARSTRSLAIAYEAGVRIAAGTDAGSPANHVWGLPLELELMAACGMSNADVLQSATSAGAELAGRLDAGVIEEGKVADLLLVDGDPLASISDIRNVAAVFTGGRAVEL